MIYYETGSPETALSADDLKQGMFSALEDYRGDGKKSWWFHLTTPACRPVPVS